MATQTNPLYTWLKKQSYWVYGAAPTQGFTHTLLDGGKLAVPDSASDSFLDQYASALAVSKQYVVELKTPIFRMFMDIDIKDSPTKLADDDLIALASFIYCKCYMPWAQANAMEMSDMVIDVRSQIDDLDAAKKGSLSDATKYGVHLIWQSWLVDCQEAAGFCDLCAAKCAADFKAFGLPSGTSWKRVLDPSVYKGSGLRMTGSRKPGSAFAYLPGALIVAGGEVTRIANPWSRIRYWMDKTSIRVTSSMLSRLSTANSSSEPGLIADSPPASITESGFSADDDGGAAGAMAGFLQNRSRQRSVHMQHPPLSVAVEQDESAIIAQRHGRFLSHIPTTKVSDIMGCLKALVPVRQYKTMKISNVYRASAGSRDPTFVIGTSSKFCLNKVSGYHNSNHVYFLFTKDGLFQKCFCQCETTIGRKLGMCKTFAHRVLCQSSVRDLYARCVVATQVNHDQGTLQKDQKKASAAK